MEGLFSGHNRSTIQAKLVLLPARNKCHHALHFELPTSNLWFCALCPVPSQQAFSAGGWWRDAE
eukprot:scaffold18553_cov90-Skeletonema_dohrnii-CCMP3373.AAC.1